MTRRTLLGGLSAAMLDAAPAAALPYRILDPHVHVWKRDPAYPFVAGSKDPDHDAAPETLLAHMKANNVSKTVIIQVRHYMFDNRFLANVLRQYPGTFQGVCRVDPQDPAAPDHLSKLTQEDHFRGVRISPTGDAKGDWIKGDLMPPLWARCRDLKVPMTVLTSISRMPDVAKLVERYPDLTVVIDHMADCPVDQPQELEKLIALKRYPKIFVKVSHTWSLSKQEYPWKDAQELVKRLHAAFGPKRLMWATDWPISEPKATYAQTLSVVRDEMKFLNDEDRHWMLSKSIEEVWPFPEAAH